MKQSFIYTSQSEVIAAFWAAHPDLTEVEGRHNQQNATARSAFSAYVDSLAKDGDISEELAQRVTLG